MAMFQKRHYDFLAKMIRDSQSFSNDDERAKVATLLGSWFSFYMDGFNRAKWDEACVRRD